MLNELSPGGSGRCSAWCRRAGGGASGACERAVLAWNEAGGGAELSPGGPQGSLARPLRARRGGAALGRAMLASRRAPAAVLRLPPGLVLERQVTLPLAAEQGLDRVVRYEMDRFTPFAAERCSSPRPCGGATARKAS